nr:importin-5-like [Nicotiana tomentosiformis]
MDTYLTQFQNAQMKAILRPGSRVPFETFISDQCSEAESMFYLMKHKDPESLALKFGVLDIEDDPAWHSAETGSDNTGATSNFKVGVDCLGRFSVALGGKCIAHTAKEQLSAYLVAPQWEKHHAALNALACIAKGCSKLVMFKNLKQPVNMALSCFQDPHPRVILAACEAIQNLSTVYCPDYREQYHNQAVPALAATLDYSHPRVQASAALALWKFCECNKPETLKPYLDELVNKLLVLIQNSKLMVQEAALRALSRLSLSVKGHFWTYYDTVMPHLKAVLRNADLKSNHRLHGLALQCISFVGSAGGKEKFREDAEQVMEGIISLQGLYSKGGEPISLNLLRTCGNICTCLGRDFLPYTSEVMPFFIIQCAQLEPVSICLILCCYADKLEEDFYPWIPQVVSIVLPLLKFHTHNVRKTAVEAMYNLLYSAKLAVEKGIAQGGSESYFTKLSDDIILSLIEALHEEPMIEVCPFMLDRLNDCLQICGPLVNEGQLHRIVDEVKHVITESSNRNGKLKERAKSEDFDAEEDELLRGVKEQEDNIFVQLRRILKTLIKTFKAAFLPFFDELSSYLIPMWGKENTAQKRCTPIDIFASLVMECPEVTLKYCDVFLPLFLDASNDEHPTVRQRALYGLELYAEYGGAVFKHFVTEAVSRINVVIMHFRAREPENENVYYSAVFALGKICQFHWESIGSAQEKMSSGELLNVEPLDLKYP